MLITPPEVDNGITTAVIEHVGKGQKDSRFQCHRKTNDTGQDEKVEILHREFESTAAELVSLQPARDSFENARAEHTSYRTSNVLVLCNEVELKRGESRLKQANGN